MKQEILFASMVDFHTIRYTLQPAEAQGAIHSVKLYAGEREITVSSYANGCIRTAEALDIAGLYEIEIEGIGRKIVMPTEIFDCEEFILRYTYDGDDLGVVIHDDGTVFKVWAPTASKVVLNLFAAGHACDAYRKVEMMKGERGVWSAKEPCGHGTYYTYTVTSNTGEEVKFLATFYRSPYAYFVVLYAAVADVFDGRLRSFLDYASDVGCA